MEIKTQLKEHAPSFVVLLLLAAIAAAIAFASLDLRRTPQSQTAAAQGAINYFTGLDIEGNAAVVIDMQSGAILYEKNADVQLPLASLTKVMLVLVAAEVLPLDSTITIPYYASGAGQNGHLTKGEQWHVRDIIDFTLIASSNSGAEILADAADAPLHERYPDSPAGATLWRMNEIARDLELYRTYFLNVSGLDLSETQAGAYGSARDVANLFAYAAESAPSLFAATAHEDILLTAENGEERTAFNTNMAQGAIPGLIMGKTGTTDLAGGNLAIVFDVGLAHPVVAVVLGSSENGRFNDMQKLIAATQKSIAGTDYTL